MTVCQISRNNAESRIRNILAGKLDTEWDVSGPAAVSATEEHGAQQRDLEQDARDLITGFISRNYRGQALVRLVAGILCAQGYYVEEGPWVGADAGIDAIAGRGPLGFDRPRIAVQVKSSDTPLVPTP